MIADKMSTAATVIDWRWHRTPLRCRYPDGLRGFLSSVLWFSDFPAHVTRSRVVQLHRHPVWRRRCLSVASPVGHSEIAEADRAGAYDLSESGHLSVTVCASFLLHVSF